MKYSPLRCHSCAYCGLPCRPTRDHVVPQSLGGRATNHRGINVLPACQQCNGLKQCIPWEWWLRAMPTEPENSGPSLTSMIAWFDAPAIRGVKSIRWIRDDVAAELERRTSAAKAERARIEAGLSRLTYRDVGPCTWAADDVLGVVRDERGEG